MIEEWYQFNEDKLKVVSLITAALVLGFAIYRWLLLKWRSDVSLRKYAHFVSLPSSHVAAEQPLQVDVPVEQRIELSLSDAEGEVLAILHSGKTPVGMLELHLDMSSRPVGDYEITMVCDDQRAVKKIRWSGVIQEA